MPDDTIVNLEELAQNLPDHPERYTELADVDISSLSFDDLETYSALLEQFAPQMDSNTVDSLRARIEERVKDLEAVEPVEETAEDVVEDEPVDESAEDVVEDEPAEEKVEAVVHEAFNPQEVLAEWNQAQEVADEAKMEEIGQRVADVLPHISEEDIQNSSLDDVYALYDLLEDETFRNHLPMKAYQNAENIRYSLFWHRINDFEIRYGLHPLQDAATVENSHKTLGAISTEELIKGLDDETKDLLNRLTVVHPVTKTIETKIKEHVDQDQPDRDIALMLERIRFETQMVVANCTKPNEDVKDAFQKEFQDRLQYHIATLAGDEKIRAILSNEGKKPSNNELKAIYQNLLQTEKPISVDQRTLAVWHAQSQQDAETALKRMDKQQEYKEIVQTLRGRLAEIDEKCHKKYGNWYNLAKTALKSAGWGAAYSVGAAFGPIGITAVASASFANNAYKQYKEYKKAKENNPELKFWGYLKKDKMALASLGLGLVSTVTAAVGISGDTVVKTTKMVAGASLGLAGAFKASAKAFKETEGSRFDKTKAALKSFGASAAGFVVGMWAGQAAGSAIGSHINTDTQIPTENNLDGVSQPINETPVNEVPVHGAPVHDVPPQEGTIHNAPLSSGEYPTVPLRAGEDVQNLWEGVSPLTNTDLNGENPYPNVPLNPEYEAELREQSTAEVSGNDAPTSETPVIDLDNLTDQQHHDLEMLFQRDPRELYEILGKHGITSEHFSSADAQALYNSAPDDVKTEAIQFASERFDDRGNFQDVKGYPSAAQMEAEARGWTAAHTQSAEQPQAQPETEPSPAYSEPDEMTAPAPDENLDQWSWPDTSTSTFEDTMTNASTFSSAEQTPYMQPEMTTPEKIGMEQIDKIKVHGDDVKVVGRDAEGHRAVEHLENREGISNSKIKITDDQTKVVRNNGYFERDVYKLDQEGNGTVTRLSFENGRHHEQMDPNTAKEMERIRSMLHPQESKTTETSASTHTSSANHTNTRFVGRNGR